jgi:hypothetical protein
MKQALPVAGIHGRGAGLATVPYGRRGAAGARVLAPRRRSRVPRRQVIQLSLSTISSLARLALEGAHVIRSTKRARHAGGSNGSAKYCVSRTTLAAWNSMMLTVLTRRPS